jgi:endonuclease YncB( thermonuclease family)
VLFAVALAETVTVSRVVDGDTFKTANGETVRIMGIDAPENDAASTSHLSNLIFNKTVTLKTDTEERDKYGRRLAIVELADGTDVAGKMVEDGYAMVYLKYPCSRNDIYLELEIAALRAGRGMWAGHFQSTIGDKAPAAVDPSQLSLPLTGSTQSESVSPSHETVYATRTGSKYHRGSCSYLSKSKIPLALEDAAARYGPCSKCSPPLLQTGPAPAPSSTLDQSTPPTSGQCAAITKKGTRCKRNAASGSAYCWQHGG